MLDLVAHVGHQIRTRGLFEPGQSILVAVSGGVDSVVLLDLLQRLGKTRGWRLRIAHLNHQLRGQSSLADERLVRDTAQRMRIPITVQRTNVRALAKAEKVSIEMAARKARHQFLSDAAANHRIAVITLAHHADDQVELFFLRLLRGSGTEALAGMNWQNPSPANAAIRLVRPLLDVSKADLHAYAKARQLPFREDATNKSTDFLRNRVRNELLPVLQKKYQPSLAGTVLRTMEILRAENDLIAAWAAAWLAKPEPAFDRLSPALQRRCLHEQLLNLGLTPSFDLVEKLRLKPEAPIGASWHRPETQSRSRQPSSPADAVLVVRKGNSLVRIQECMQSTSPDEVQMIEPAKSVRGQTEFGGRKLKWSFSQALEGKFPKSQKGREFFDAERIGSPVFLRHWRPGDRFQPIGMSSAIKLQDLFVNQKVPRPLRHRLIVATTADGEIFWVQNLRISERFKLTKRTRRRLQWSWEPV